MLASTISGNYSDGPGGGIHANAGPGGGFTPVTVINSTISGNASETAGGHGGGGISLAHASLTVRGSTITQNTSRYGGGGIHAGLDLGPIALTNTIVAQNTNQAGGADCVSLAASRPITDGGHNIIGQNTGSAPTGCPGLADGVNGTQVGTAASPIDPLLGPLTVSGGRTATRAPLAGSPAIGHGDAAACRTAPMSDRDQRNLPRNSANRGACDVGAYDTGG